MAEHQWEPYAGILAQEPSLSIARQAGMGPHSRTCAICGVITSDEDDCADLECTPGRHR